ncbi:DUF4269 domain-containing protein [Bradyrhizobium sp. USDA 4503]
MAGRSNCTVICVWWSNNEAGSISRSNGGCLRLMMEGLRRAVRELRAGGLKTEPAFATVLGISGDPYRGLLELAAETDAELRVRLAACDFG